MPKFEVRIDQERCKECGYCIKFCPQGVLKLSSSFNSIGYHPAMVENPDKCKGCVICARDMCPEAAWESVLKGLEGYLADVGKSKFFEANKKALEAGAEAARR